MARLITVFARYIRPVGVRSLSRIVESPFSPVNIPDETLPEYIWKDVPRWADKPAITCAVSGRSYKFEEARGLSHRFATSLLSNTGLVPGDVIGLHLPNIPEFLPIIYGAFEAGLIVTCINPLYTPDEIRRQFEDARVKCCVTLPQLFPIIQQVIPTLKNYKSTILIGATQHDSSAKTLSFQQLLTEPGNAEVKRPSTSNVALLPYSSGTMGAPKGVLLTHKNLVSNLEQNRHPDILDHIPTSDVFQERVLSILPFFHIYGFNGILNTCLIHGLHTIIMPKFTPEDYIACLIKYKPTFLFVVPSLLQFLTSHPAVKKEHLQTVNKVVSGAAPASKALIDKFRSKVGRDDIRVSQGYGMTESSPVLLNARRGIPNNKATSAGQLMPLTQARVIDLDSGEDLGPNETGELLFKGPQLMLGYLNNEEATRQTIDKDGWLHTGDVGYYDEDGYFFIVDRSKELIKVKGNQVSPVELESILMEIPGIADVAVVGVPDDTAGEVPRAFVVRQHGSQITENDIINYIEPRVVKYKKLSGGVKFIDVIPRNAAGKVIRQQLRAISSKAQ